MRYLHSQDRLQVGYAALTSALTWFHKRGLELEYDEYIQMLKMVGFSYISDRYCLPEPSFTSFDKGLTVLEATTHRSSRVLCPNG
jgi:hypothetical protein